MRRCSGAAAAAVPVISRTQYFPRQQSLRTHEVWFTNASSSGRFTKICSNQQQGVHCGAHVQWCTAPILCASGFKAHSLLAETAWAAWYAVSHCPCVPPCYPKTCSSWHQSLRQQQQNCSALRSTCIKNSHRPAAAPTTVCDGVPLAVRGVASALIFAQAARCLEEGICRSAASGQHAQLISC